MSKSRIHLILIVTLLLACAGQTLAQTVAAKSDEPKLIAVLKDSAAPLKAKIDACRQLAIMGGKDSIAPLAALLGDEQLSHNARYALQMNPDPAVDEALRDALGKVKGRPLVGVIHTVGYRRDAKAVGTLGDSLVNSGNPMVAGAAARALGDIGNSEAAASPAAGAAAKSRPSASSTVYEGLLRCAESLAARARSRTPSRSTTSCTSRMPRIRFAAGPCGPRFSPATPAGRQKLLQEQLGNEDYILFSAAVEASHQMRSAKATTILTDAMKSLPADRRILVIQALGVRGEKGAAPALLDAAQERRPAAFASRRSRPLTELGDASAVPVLVQLLDDGDREIAKAAQDGLATFPGREADAVVTQMFAGDECGQAAAGPRPDGTSADDRAACPALVKAAGDADSKVRTDAIKMIGDLGGSDQLPTMLDLLENVQGSQELAAVEQAMTAICLKIARFEVAGRQADRPARQGRAGAEGRRWSACSARSAGRMPCRRSVRAPRATMPTCVRLRPVPWARGRRSTPLLLCWRWPRRPAIRRKRRCSFAVT